MYGTPCYVILIINYYIILCSAELELIDETIEIDDEEIKSLETLKEIVQMPEKYPFKEYTVACLVQRFTNNRLLFLLNKPSARLRKVDFEKLIDKLSSGVHHAAWSVQLRQLGLTKEYCYSLI